MQSYEFSATGHQNVRATHKTTLEVTKSKELRPEGDCVIAVNADFDGKQLKHLVHSCDKIRITLCAGLLSESFEAISNKRFDADDDVVIRMGEFDSARTLGIRATKSAAYLRREFVEKLKNPLQKVVVRIEEIND